MAGGGSEGDAAAVDLTALMDILSNIIFFLMASFGAAVIAVVPATVPTISEGGDSDVAIETDKVTLGVTVKANGEISMSVSNQDIPPNQLERMNKRLPPVDGHVDVKGLTAHAWTIKQRYPRSKDAIINPEGKVTYGMLVDTMDATRTRFEKKGGQGDYVPMFPAAVLSSRVE